MAEETNRVLLVDDHPVARAGLRHLLESNGFVVVAEAGNGEEACSLYQAIRPDLVLMDISMPGIGGLEALRRIRAGDRKARVMMLTMHDSEAMLTAAIAAGASAYLTKQAQSAEILHAIHQVALGQRLFAPHLVNAMLAYVGDEKLRSPLDRLSKREGEVFRLLVADNSVQDVARILAISPKTVGVHHTRIKKKLGVCSTVQLMRLALQCELIYP